ncbi:MAG TPA: 2-dehydro-3-deoxygalactonokinase [Propylenella sp.]
MPRKAALIGVDWGTTSFRAFLLDAEGAVLDRRTGPHGILSVKDSGFGGVLTGQVGGWLEKAQLPVVMSGMIGSRQGWIEAPYVTTPAGVADLAAALVRVSFEAAEVHVVPGVETANAAMRDVMRGEETQVFGALLERGLDRARFLLPGTHSKWVQAEAGRIARFSTYMTGEIFAACRDHTILGRLIEQGEGDPAVFLRGVRQGARAGSPGALLNRLFGVRTAGLFGEIAGAALGDYLSGLLIGAEIADAGSQATGPVFIVASHDLAERYRTATAELGVDAEAVPSESVVRAHLAIARTAGLLQAAAGA